MGAQIKFHALAKRKVAALLVDVGEGRFENLTDWLPPSAIELNKSQLFNRTKVPRCREIAKLRLKPCPLQTLPLS
jgi:hypothetical protein